jgi:Protein of unknown function (DUF3429)
MGAPTPVARALGYAGLVPFVLAAAVAVGVSAEPAATAQSVLLAYGATIASFLGGIHWGFAMRRGDATGALLGWGVVPSLVAWGAWLLGAPDGLFVMAALLVACWLRDRTVYPGEGAGAWLGLRLQLTVVAAGSCLIGALGR